MKVAEALKLVHDKMLYERCRRKDHGIGEMITYGGKTAPCRFVICPIIQFYPKPSYRFHSWRDFIKFVEERIKEDWKR